MRQFLLSLDGLCLDDLQDLYVLLPKSRGCIEALAAHTMGGCFVAAQPIWAEILTGEPWYDNGCVAYAHPTTSLNKLEVFTESQLLRNVKIFDSSSPSRAVTINIPLLRPKPAERYWLSDGSLPINKIFSPSNLSSLPHLDEYQPRPYQTLALATGTETEVAKRSLMIEEQRLDCASTLFNRISDWTHFVLRLSVFDSLHHCLGMHFLGAKDLQVSPNVKRFMEKLDQFLFEVFSIEDLDVTLISAYSHIPCRGVVNLNTVLKNGGFLDIESATLASARMATERLKASSTLHGANGIVQQLVSFEGRLKAADTKAASPVSSAVFINSKESFADGCVESSQYSQIRENVKQYLRARFYERFGESYSLVEKPSDVQTSSTMPLPDFIILIEGIEFHDLEDAQIRAPIPRTTHHPTGFALLAKGRCASDNIQPRDLAPLIAN